ncbi:UDP-sugar pyrophosphorylase 1 [Hondaea fermentalgiana]|uniref:UTP-monosaccharide-1-phosphate uridylyltransferase n=1 Tax=Hondaea fermentalgiana TaxID=2315210 RepID=A0A2R5GLJ1_9STRA|nr:UDP-sugar pyrophosphorylase 1 [Hondaea fermentalgiana]|eukprot:GBG31772.1 UDP-sugar pyrophosphorylase 1 [Hondaea fermentalgiana]
MAQDLRAALEDEGQTHLFDSAGDAQDDLMEQLQTLNANYPGGLPAYVRRARDLLEKSKRGDNPFEGYTPKIPECVTFPFEALHKERAEAEAAGRAAFAQCACVLVAGGLGERLGYSGIKVELPSEITSGTSFLGLYCQYIAALQDPASPVPLAIMTSDDTHDKTLELLEREDYFGLDRDQVHLMKQEKVACLADNEPKLAIDPKDPARVLTKPHGHGDVHLLLYQTGLAQDWLDAGREWVLFFQDTNPLSFRTMPATLGVSVMSGYQVNSVAIPRKAKAAAGALMRLCHQDGHEITVNVEYNYIDSLLRATVSPDEGDVNGDDGYSAFPGNMNQLIFALEPYVKTLEKTGGVIPEFVNPKYADETRTVFKSPTRLECMMQDYPLTLRDLGEPPAPGSIGVTVFQDAGAMENDALNGPPSLTHRLYAPAKNNLHDAAQKAGKGIPDASCTSTELAIYACNALMLRDLGCEIGAPASAAYGGFAQPEWPHIVLLPSFCPLFSELPARFEQPDQVKVSSRSTLVISGDITFAGPVDVDGTLVLTAAPGVKVRVGAVKVRNEPATFAAVDPDDEAELEVYRIRGFKLERPVLYDGGHPVEDADFVVRYEDPGEHEVDRIEL